jgi:hypothetical protein
MGSPRMLLEHRYHIHKVDVCRYEDNEVAC